MQWQRVPVLVFSFLGLISCQPRGPETGAFEKGRLLGTNHNLKLPEASGLVASIKNPGMLWSLNDSGNPAELFLLDTLAQTKKVFRFPQLKNRDWEDIAIGTYPASNKPCIFIGDIGDNLSRYGVKYIYRLPEPTVNDSTEITVVDKLTVILSDEVRDTEALMSDPISKNLYLVSKREKKVALYEIKNPFTSDTVIAQMLFKLDLKDIVAGDISPDGTEVLMKNYENIYYWKKSNNESLTELLQTPPVILPYEPETQGESIAWSRDVSGYYTISENTRKEHGKLFFYRRKK
jgi:hypothetical protein